MHFFRIHERGFSSLRRIYFRNRSQSLSKEFLCCPSDKTAQKLKTIPYSFSSNQFSTASLVSLLQGHFVTSTKCLQTNNVLNILVEVSNCIFCEMSFATFSRTSEKLWLSKNMISDNSINHLILEVSVKLFWKISLINAVKVLQKQVSSLIEALSAFFEKCVH